MSYIKQSPDNIRNNISWPSGPPSRMFKEEGVKGFEQGPGDLSGDPGNPRPPTRGEFIKLLKGCDVLSSREGP